MSNHRMASAREYSNLTGGIRRDVVSMIEKAVAQKRKGEGLVVHGSQCHGFIDSQLETVRETNFLDGTPQRAMTLAPSPTQAPGSKLELSLEVSVVGSAGQAASKAVKKWGTKSSGETRSRLRSSDRGSSSPKISGAGETLVLETERVLRARRDASVVVNVRERTESETAGSRGKSAAPTWSSVSLTAEEIFRECSDKHWLGDKDSDFVYCVVKQSCNVDKNFQQLLTCIQLHLYDVSKMLGSQ